MSVDGLARTGDEAVSLASFIAWLGARVEDDQTRQRCRLVAHAYLEWSWADGGRVATRRSRFVTAAARRLELTRPQVGQALERLGEHQAIVRSPRKSDNGRLRPRSRRGA